MCIVTSFYAQEEQIKHYFGGHVSLGKSDYSSAGSIGGLSRTECSAGNYFTIGFDYAYYISDITEVCTGLSITSNDIHQASRYFGDFKTYEHNEKFFIFSVPLHLKVHFLKYLFIDSGVCFNFHPSMGYTWGAGAGIDVGAEYTFESAVSIFAGYQFQWNFLNFWNIFSSKENSAEVIKDNLNQKGFTIGLGYRF